MDARGFIQLTPLMRASAIGHVEIVRELIEEGADVNQRGPRGATALMFAAGGGHLEVVKELVAYGADLAATEEGGWNALRHAEEDNDEEVATFLKHSALPGRDIKVMPALQRARSNYRLDSYS